MIAKRPTGGEVASSANMSGPAPTAKPAASSGLPVVKTLSIGGETPAGAASKTKVLSIGVPVPAAPAAKKDASAEEGAKTAASKAIEKTGESTTATNGKISPSPSSGRSSPSAAEAAQEAKREADAVAKEQAADVDEEVLDEVYGKEHVNLIFIGHVDAGKSTLGGSILYATGMVDERTMDKYKREAKEAGRETWYGSNSMEETVLTRAYFRYLSWALDLTKEERSKGKTVEVGRGFFETEKRRYTILDAPGHKTFVSRGNRLSRSQEQANACHIRYRI